MKIIQIYIIDESEKIAYQVTVFNAVYRLMKLV